MAALLRMVVDRCRSLLFSGCRWHHHPVTTRFSVCAEALAGARPSTASLGCGGRSDCNSWRGPLPRRHCLALGRCLMLLALACGDNTFTLELGPQLIQHVEAYRTPRVKFSLRKLLNVLSIVLQCRFECRCKLVFFFYSMYYFMVTGVPYTNLIL